MELTEIKKALYTEKPLAGFERATQHSLLYTATVKENEDQDYTTYFHIPIKDIGEATFEKFMPAQHLIRWIVLPQINE